MNSRFRQTGPRDQMTVVLMAIEGHIDNAKDGIPLKPDYLLELIEDARKLTRFLPEKWCDQES